MPGTLLRVYATMLPRLEAERHLAEHQARAAAGQLMMEDRPRAQYLHQLEMQASGKKRAKRPTAQQLQAMGIGVRKEGGGEPRSRSKARKGVKKDG